MFLVGRLVSLSGGIGLFLASFFAWFWGMGRGFRMVENAWQGEESLAAVILMLIAMLLLAVGWAWGRGWLALGILELILSVVCFGLILFYIVYNNRPVIIRGHQYPTGIGAGALMGLFSSAVMIVGSILNLSSGGPIPRDEEIALEMDDEEDDWGEPPRQRRRRRRPPAPRRTSRRRLQEE